MKEMYSRKPSNKELEKLHGLVKDINNSVDQAHDYASKIELLSAKNSLEAIGAIMDRLLESLSATLESEEA